MELGDELRLVKRVQQVLPKGSLKLEQKVEVEVI